MGKSLHRPTQNEALLNYLEEHNSITPLEALNTLGIMRLGARIADLESRGVEFIHQPVTVQNRHGQRIRVMSYALKQENMYE